MNKYPGVKIVKTIITAVLLMVTVATQAQAAQGIKAPTLPHVWTLDSEKNYAEGYYFYLFDGVGTVFQGFMTINNYIPFSKHDSIVEFWAYKEGKLLLREHLEFDSDEMAVDQGAGTVKVGNYVFTFGKDVTLKWDNGADKGSFTVSPQVKALQFDPPLIKDDKWTLTYPVPWGIVSLDVVQDGVKLKLDGYGSVSHYRSTKKLTKIFVQWQNLFMVGSGSDGIFYTRMVNDDGLVKVGAVRFDGTKAVPLNDVQMIPKTIETHALSKHQYPIAFELGGELAAGAKSCHVSSPHATIQVSPLDEAGWMLKKVAKIFFGNPWSFDNTVECRVDGSASALYRGVLADDIIK